MDDKFTTIKTFRFPAEVAIVESFLEMRNIEFYVKNLAINQISYPIGDIEIQVKEADYKIAKTALIEGGFASEKDFTY